MKALITGITGFAGSHLAEYLLAEHPDVEVYGTYRWRSRMDNVEHLRGTNPRSSRPTCATTPRCTATLDRIAAGLHLPSRGAELRAGELDGARRDADHQRHRPDQPLRGDPRAARSTRWCSSPARASSTAWCCPDEVPIKETNPLRPLSPYAVSKVAQDLLGYQYFQSYGLKVIRTRGFNHTGPRRGQVFVTSNFCSQVAAIELRACRSR